MYNWHIEIMPFDCPERTLWGDDNGVDGNCDIARQGEMCHKKLPLDVPQ